MRLLQILRGKTLSFAIDRHCPREVGSTDMAAVALDTALLHPAASADEVLVCCDRW
jgi:hypothetical protein